MKNVESVRPEFKSLFCYMLCDRGHFTLSLCIYIPICKMGITAVVVRIKLEKFLKPLEQYEAH